MKINVGLTDRIIRLLLTAGLVVVIMNDMVIGIGSQLLTFLSLILFLTAIFGKCPLYSLLGINNLKSFLPIILGFAGYFPPLKGEFHPNPFKKLCKNLTFKISLNTPIFGFIIIRF